MARQTRTKLVQPKPDLRNQAVNILEEPNVVRQREEPVSTELDLEMECPRCHEIMELQSSFDKLLYCCDSCSFILKCV